MSRMVILRRISDLVVWSVIVIHWIVEMDNTKSKSLSFVALERSSGCSMLEWSILAGCKSGYQPTSGETERSAPEKRWIRRVSKVSKHLGTRSVVKSVDQRPSANISEKRRPSGRFIKWRTADCIANFVPIPRRRTPVNFGEVWGIAHASGPWRATAVNSRSSSEGKEQTKSKTSGSWVARQAKERDRRVCDNPCSGRKTP